MRKPLALLASILLSLDAACVHAAAPARQSAPVPDAPAEDSGIALDLLFLIGVWTDDGDCDSSTLIEFRADGAFRLTDGNTGRWKLDGDRLTMSGETTATVRIVPIDRDTITVVNEDGSLGHSTRCAQPSLPIGPGRNSAETGRAHDRPHANGSRLAPAVL